MSLQNCDSDNVGSTFEKEAVDQHKLLMSLKRQHEELDQEIEQKIAELNRSHQKRILLRDEIETCCIRTLKKEAALAKVQATSQSSQKEAKEIECQIKKEKQVQIEYLKVYENKMASIADNLRSGSKIYDRKNIADEISSLRQENSAIDKQLVSLEEKLNDFRAKYGSMFKESLDKSDITEGGTLQLSALQHVISQLAEEKQLYNYEYQKRCEEIRNLSKNLSTLEEDLRRLKQGHVILE
ncbi:uncharacterized protein LOC110831972 [Zootermopsis nevadensis]|uniref:Uncharacterized protein n=1 Tax=Zootermopsis nevadensis TaxID=136037 RepID=A0A067R2I3_ZOONE|nr:uncharacterized protein LOC110831972 [Zootermopsis nevadensis]KDR17131.1 hypothetical protein L798_08389 [Zootermopsis nevadensis]